MILLIDNYDSFTYNLYQYIGEIYEDIKVARNDEISLENIERLKPKGIILSPGPGIPENAGICIDVIKRFGGQIPILGICLGHQAIGCAYGGKVIRANHIMHGKTSEISIKQNKLFQNLEKFMTVMRYHSLVIEKDTFPDELFITGESLDDGEIMAVKHKEYEVYGLQFHPESILTENGKTMIKNFVKEICNAAGDN
ncbi:aminodeoxychorismate/anthranilate synthase component II [Clostridium sp. P21]|uniref:Aminodeoxychorismate/anthranilate synthase component II n=1 Tax=Clostridium muellerianum TaxID=2716538 RepID=A0A7Y0EHT7_9CLOT|nr:aminodeoxychorismate/anthranilate synthase component II [Clostridium muellerianum]NMM63651.1 aminodeoxychorismate/anthranilate synthase component II [Clostridium muellerianum]